MASSRLGHILAIVFLSGLLSSPAVAQQRWIQLSLVTPIQIFPEADSIAGVRINLIYGRNVSMVGFDLGVVNHTTTGTFKGFQVGIAGISDSAFMGLQHNWFNVTGGKLEGAQSGFVNLAGSAGGFQGGWLNHVGAIKGFQLGMVNYAENMGGFQLGIVNYAKRTNGLQIGLVNIIKEGGAFPFFPIVNWSF
ncbi:MAG: hypothetical protein AMS18_15670 [Gemmatimonas sp. SG8_17]|nr:MAG: hypothetical protein AMS18_15670 [Gemmatimonas sp. SG8_17]